MTLAGGFPAVLVFAFLFSSITSLISAQAILKPIWKTDPTKQTNQTITDIPFRNPFTPEEILTTMSSHKFDFPFWDPIHDNITITRNGDNWAQNRKITRKYATLYRRKFHDNY